MFVMVLVALTVLERFGGGFQPDSILEISQDTEVSQAQEASFIRQPAVHCVLCTVQYRTV